MDTSMLINSLLKIQETEQLLLDPEEIVLASQSRLVLIREIVGEILPLYPSDFSLPLSLKLLQDKNADVRSSAAIGLQNRSEKSVYTALKTSFLCDPIPMVRAYAGCSLVSNSNFVIARDLPWIEEILSREKSYLVRTMCYGELYKKESNPQFFKKIVRGFNSKIYQTRIATINTLGYILNTSNAVQILESTEHMLKKENLEVIRKAIVSLREAAVNKIGHCFPSCDSTTE